MTPPRTKPDPLSASLIWMLTIHDELLVLLRTHSAAINSMSRRGWFARPWFDYMSGGVVWTDETRTSGSLLDAIRPLFYHRSVLIMESADSEWADYWLTAKTLVPNWIGFHPSRCRSTPKLRRLIESGNVNLESDLSAFQTDIEPHGG